MLKQEIKKIKVKDLHLWTENPRDHISLDDTDYDVMKRALENNNSKWNLSKLIDEMGPYYDFSELPTVVETNGKFVVYDGNRRIAVLKYLQDQALYSSLGGGLFFREEPRELRELVEIPCNICDKEIALTNVERKHINSGSWDALERDYFRYIHRGYDKTIFLKLEEQTSIISSNPKLNQRFVKEEVLNEQNLKEIGIYFDQEKGFLTNYTKEENEGLIEKIISLVEDGRINTRGDNRKKLKQTLLDNYPELAGKIQSFDAKGEIGVFQGKNNKKDEQIKNTRKTSRTKTNSQLFGKILLLKQSDVNNLYCAICKVYDKCGTDEHVLAIIGMSLRLILDVAAREYYTDKGDEKRVGQDQLYKSFLKDVKNEMNSQADINYLSLTSEWLSDKYNMDGALAKYGHGNIVTTQRDVLKVSCIVADILEMHFKK